ncbi:hypothetical protein ACGGZK_07790 [Agromyces sp. MMS24-K17]|uniref:hypothetical protein n=1 Tax=Agromyces sp. MMS24-K17 TaxID=3372850 RepID=UPI003754EF78
MARKTSSDGPDAVSPGAAKRALDPMNPFDGKPGFFNRLNRIVYMFTGPAQVGIGRPEAPYVPPADPKCPLCGRLMADHEIDRSGPRTQLHCPAAG